MEQIQSNSPNVNLNDGQGEDNSHHNQLKTIFHYLQENVATASMVSEATGVPQKNICRYKRDLEFSGRLWEVEKSECQETGYKAWYLTTNPKHSPQRRQLSLFDFLETSPLTIVND